MEKDNNDFRIYADSAPFATLIYNDSQKWIYANLESQLLTGFNESELLSQFFWEIVAQDYQPLIKERGLSRLEGHWPKDKYEMQIIQKNGEPKWIEIHMNKIQMEGKMAIIVGAIDIDVKKRNELELIKSRKQYKILSDNLIEGVILLNSTYTIEFINPSGQQIFQRTSDQMIGKNITQACFYEHRFKVIKLLQKAKTYGICSDEFNFSHENSLLLFEIHVKYLENEDKYLLVMHDITDREMASKNESNLVTLQNTFIKLVSEIVKSGIEEDTYSRVLKMAIEIVPGVQAGSVLLRDGDCYRFAAAIGYDFSLLKKLTLKEDELLQTSTHDIGIIRNLKQQNEKNFNDDRGYVLNTAGRTEEINEMLSIPIVIDSRVVAFFNLDNLERKPKITDESIKMARLFSDVITAIMQKNQYEQTLSMKNIELKKLSNYDPLTNLVNRRFLSENISQLFQEVKNTGTILYLLYIDLNNFKSINDNYGHEFGDLLLAAFGERIKERVRNADMVSRIGGDEFLLLLTSLTHEDIIKFLNRFIDEIKEPFIVQSKKFYISASIGISRFPADGETFKELLKKADMAMYSAKNEKKPYEFFTAFHDQ
ncbi:MAG TPA: sensor domain-containing diguanylate cyclase [Thermotogota bacterium]|nr:sensor domain-containing diguanylate cyclase [Thermotogota bacterium]HRW34845.1 sensor domain-containing diguanylate cyclase [Thermotogota bacterium]